MGAQTRITWQGWIALAMLTTCVVLIVVTFFQLFFQFSVPVLALTTIGIVLYMHLRKPTR